MICPLAKTISQIFLNRDIFTHIAVHAIGVCYNFGGIAGLEPDCITPIYGVGCKIKAWTLNVNPCIDSKASSSRQSAVPSTRSDI